MTLQQLDDVLTTWQGRLAAMADNLLELQAEANYRSLTGEGGLTRVALQGATEARVGPAVASVHNLFSCFAALQSTIDQAASLRRELPAFFGAEARAREIHRLLFSPSIDLESSPSLPARDLLTEGGQPRRYTPDEIMELMVVQFGGVRDAVNAARDAWNAFGELADRQEVELERLRGQTVVPTALLAPALTAIEAQLVPLRDVAQSDPLGAVARLHQEIEPALAMVAGQLSRAEALAFQLRGAQACWEELRGTQIVLAGLLQRCQAVIAPKVAEGASSSSAPDHVESSIEALGQWRGRLEDRLDRGAYDAVGLGLKNWNTAASRLLQELREAVAQGERELAQRDELRGRLRALKAKARAHRGSSSPELLALGTKAEDLVTAEPLALAAAARALTQFEDGLRSAAAASSSRPGNGSG